MADEKTSLRRILRETREALGPSVRDRLSRDIQCRLLGAELYLNSGAVVLYAAIGNEVATDLLLADALGRRRKVYFPRTHTERRSIALVEVSGPSDLSPGALGISEPRGDVEIEPNRLGQALEPVSQTASEHDQNAGEVDEAQRELRAKPLVRPVLVCVPGVAFSPSGRRLGRGGGYYDRLIAELSPEATTVGLAYSFQLLDTLPEDASDRRVQFIATESGVHAAGEIAAAAQHRADRGGTSTCPKH